MSYPTPASGDHPLLYGRRDTSTPTQDLAELIRARMHHALQEGKTAATRMDSQILVLEAYPTEVFPWLELTR